MTLLQKHKTTLKHLFLTFLTFAILVASGYNTRAAEPYIKNSHTVSLQQVEDLSRLDVCADLSRCRFIADEFDVRILEHDSVISVMFPDRRYDFCNHKDTTFLIGEETRAMQMTFAAGMALATDGIQSHASRNVTGTGRYRQSHNISSQSDAIIFPASASVLVTLQCDTLTDIRYDHTRRICRYIFIDDSVKSVENAPDSVIMTSVTDTYFLTAVDEVFPRVMKKVNVLSNNGNEIVDSATYVLVSNPVKSKSGRGHKLNKPHASYFPDMDKPDVSIAPDGSSITVTPSGVNNDMSVVISDVAGRIMISRAIAGNDISVVDISTLPRGEYLIQISAHGETVKVVKYTNRKP